MRLTVNLPWPSSVLSPNSRAHWRTRHKHAQAAKSAAYYLTRAQRGGHVTGPLSVSLTFCPPDRRRRDTDNMLASCKAALDGIAQALGIDDSEWRLSIARGESIRGGAVIVIVETVDEALAVVGVRACL